MSKFNKYISFYNDFNTEDNKYTYIAKVKYKITYKDDRFYYITHPINKIYPIARNLENIAYITDIINDKT